VCLCSLCLPLCSFWNIFGPLVGIRSQDFVLVVISFPCISRRERERRYWGHLSFFLINDFDNLLSWFRFFLLSMVYFCPRGGNVLQLDGEREVQREILWVEEERRGSIHSSPNCKFCARFVLIGESALQDGKVCLLCVRVERLWSASRWSRCTCSV
jgi:hypothetical protein